MLGSLIAPATRGLGFVTEIAAAPLAATWTRFDWRWIRVTLFEDNPASVRVLDMLGFAPVERGTATSRARGTAPPVRRCRLVPP